MENMENIYDYLDKYGLLKKRRGYMYLTDVINLCIEKPFLSCKELFTFLTENDSRYEGKNWSTIYRVCDYSLNQALGGKVTTFGFIKEASDYIRRNS